MSSFMRAARILNPIAAAVVVALVFVQLYLIADFIFGNAGALAVAGLASWIAYRRRSLVPIPAAAPPPQKIRR